ncbi:MAG TPA: UPF0182 family protein [Gemmatimonadaceae bacterium]|nr:UPF0182 family protein [Gemmatimonadaceae bacterium]
MTARRWAIVALVSVAAVLLLGRVVAGIYVAYRWYEALGAARLWRVETGLALALHGFSALLAALFAFANLYVVRRSIISLVLPRRVANVEIGEEVPGRYLVSAAVLLSAVLGAFLTLPRGSWMSLLLARSGMPFGDTDPYFTADIGFFAYWLPFETALFYWALVAVLVVLVVVVALYALTPSVEWKRGSVYVSHYVRRHLAVLVAILMLLLAWHYRLDAFHALITGSGPNGAFTYADLHAAIPVDVSLSIIAITASFLVGVFGWMGQPRIAAIAIAAVFVLSIGLRQVTPPLVRRAAAPGAQDTLDRPYLQMQAEYARHAFGVDRLHSPDSTLAIVSLRAAAPHVSAWDPGALARSVPGSSGGGAATAIGWVPSPAGLLATVAQRPETPPASARGLSPWTILRVTAARADSEGNPVVVGATGTSGQRQQPIEDVLVADSASGYLLVADPLHRVAAPALNTGLSRLMHAWALQNFHLLFSALPGPDPRIVTRRDLRGRIASLAPFFEQGRVITPVVHADTLYWTMTLYAASAYYPLSEHVALGDQTFTYVHHAATAVVNAQSGRVMLVADSVLGPIAESWRRIFPELFSSWRDLPSWVANGLGPSIGVARMQATIAAHLGVRGEAPHPGHVPWNDGADTLFASESEPVFVVPGDPPRTAFGAPVLNEDGRLKGLLLATGGARGATYWMGSERHPGVLWTTVTEALRHALDSSAVLTGDVRGARGRIRAVPVDGDVAFIQPDFAWRHDAPPTLARVAIWMDDSVMTGSTMRDATSLSLPLAEAPSDTTRGAAALREFRSRVASLYAAMRRALAHGDWSAFGRAYDALGELLAQPHP